MILGANWAIVLAAGEGSRLRLLTTDARGVATPKQFCSLRGGASLLEETLARAERHVPRQRVVVVVAAEHEHHWRDQLAHLPAENIVVQPKNCGTATGLLLPLLSIMARDAEPNVIVMPSDHHVSDEAILAQSVGVGLTTVSRGEAGVLLLGMTAECATSDYGWIVPGPGLGGVRSVQRFEEKPPLALAQQLMAQGALWNTFLFATRGRTLLGLLEHVAPGLARRLDDAIQLGGDTLARVYDTLASMDLSRDVFARAPQALRTVRVPACGWTDLGTPQRVIDCLAQRAVAPHDIPHRGITVSLASGVGRKAASA